LSGVGLRELVVRLTLAHRFFGRLSVQPHDFSYTDHI